MEKTLVTGGTGKLGQELQELTDGIFLSSSDLDVKDEEQVKKVFSKYNPDVCFHLAAETDLNRCEEDKQHAYDVNVKGTQYIADQCINHNTYLIYPSTDYVFDGEKGNYSEEDYPNPVNYYALTKLLGEYEVKRADKYLITRGTMKQRVKWRHPEAPKDMYESLLHHDEYAKLMFALVEKEVEGLYHLGHGRYSVYQWVSEFDSDVVPTTLDEIPFSLPKDVSLETSKLEKIIEVDEVLEGDKT